MTDAGFRVIEGGVELSGKMGFRTIFEGNLPGASHEHRQDAVRPADGFSALDHVHPHRRTTWWQNVAIAQWIRSTWEQISKENPDAAPRS